MTLLLVIGLAWPACALGVGLVVGPVLRRAAERQSTWAWTEIPDFVPFADPGTHALPEPLTTDPTLRLGAA